MGSTCSTCSTCSTAAEPLFLGGSLKMARCRPSLPSAHTILFNTNRPAIGPYLLTHPHHFHYFHAQHEILVFSRLPPVQPRIESVAGSVPCMTWAELLEMGKLEGGAVPLLHSRLFQASKHRRLGNEPRQRGWTTHQGFIVVHIIEGASQLHDEEGPLLGFLSQPLPLAFPRFKTASTLKDVSRSPLPGLPPGRTVSSPRPASMV